MPIFRFNCTTCELEFEKFVKSGVGAEACPLCGAASGKVLVKPGFVKYEGEGAHANEFPDGDRVIGKDAEVRRKINEAKWKAKREIRKTTGKVVLAKVGQEKPYGRINPMTTKDADLPSAEHFKDDYVGASDKLVATRGESLKEYSGLLKEHRDGREKKGEGQFGEKKK